MKNISVHIPVGLLTVASIHQLTAGTTSPVLLAVLGTVTAVSMAIQHFSKPDFEKLFKERLDASDKLLQQSSKNIVELRKENEVLLGKITEVEQKYSKMSIREFSKENFKF